MEPDIKKAISLIKNAKHLTVLTGAGISTLSGLADFRGKHNPIWDKFPQDKVFDSEYFRRDPSLFYGFLREIMQKEYMPNIAHIALKKLEDAGILKAVITQNIDGLHQKAGSKKVYELHGSIFSNYCVECSAAYSMDALMEKLRYQKVPLCVCGGIIRPGIVFYGEQLPVENMEMAIYHASRSDLMIAAGTSLTVQPAAYMPEYTLKNGGKIIMVNRGSTYLDERAGMVFPEIKEFFGALEEEL
jgi:NAD-dependent deacetylase